MKTEMNTDNAIIDSDKHAEFFKRIEIIDIDTNNDGDDDKGDAYAFVVIKLDGEEYTLSLSRPRVNSLSYDYDDEGVTLEGIDQSDSDMEFYEIVYDADLDFDIVSDYICEKSNAIRYVDYCEAINNGTNRNKYTTVTEAIERGIVDRYNITMKQAIWLYDNSDCPNWDIELFNRYDFLEDPEFDNIPEDDEIDNEEVAWAVPPGYSL